MSPTEQINHEQTEASPEIYAKEILHALDAVRSQRDQLVKQIEEMDKRMMNIEMGQHKLLVTANAMETMKLHNDLIEYDVCRKHTKSSSSA